MADEPKQDLKQDLKKKHPRRRRGRRGRGKGPRSTVLADAPLGKLPVPTAVRTLRKRLAALNRGQIPR